MFENKYLEEFMQANKDPLKSYSYRNRLVRKYSWAIPTIEAINLIASYSPLIEIGAGTGYWARLIAENGGDILCFDKNPPHPLDLYGHNEYNHYTRYYEVLKGEEEKILSYPNRNLFLCWIPYSTELGEKCLKYFKSDYIVYIGEDYGGCNGNDEFFELLGKQFVITQELSIPQWSGLHDYLAVYKRKKGD